MKITFLALAATTALLMACGGETKTETKTETPPNVAPVKPGELKIAFYYSDSLKTGFEFYRKEDERLTKKGEAFNNELKAREKSLMDLNERLQSRAKAGTATPDELTAMEQQLNRLNQQYMSFQQQKGAALEKETGESLTALSKKIEEAGKKYCEKYKVDMLLIHGPGGQINFINPKMDVTRSFIEFLNAEQSALEKDMGK